jgi:hypothetical protein
VGARGPSPRRPALGCSGYFNAPGFLLLFFFQNN